VWAVDDLYRRAASLAAPSQERALRVFTVSGADNSNGRAQKGLFMLHPQVLTNPFVVRFKPRGSTTFFF